VTTSNVTLAPEIETVSSSNWLKTFLSRYFYFCMSLVVAGLVVWGFSRTVDTHLFHATPPRPFLLWMHATAFSTWVVFFIAQSALVRVRRVSVHRFLGWFGAGLAVTMVLLGLRVAVVMARFDISVLHQAGIEPFLSVPFYDMATFGVCMALAIYWRKRPEYHRRLVFIASITLLDAAVGRFDFIFDHNLFYPCLDLLIMLGVVRDWFVDGRVHQVYRYALPAMILAQALTVYAWRVNPAWWQGITHSILW